MAIMSDIEIAQACEKEKITAIAARAGIPEDYLELYQRDPKDRENPYFAPLLAEDYRGLPDTLVLTAEFDPLRDEGEEYGRRLREAGSRVEIHRIAGAVHGYFALGIQHRHIGAQVRGDGLDLAVADEKVGRFKPMIPVHLCVFEQ